MPRSGIHRGDGSGAAYGSAVLLTLSPPNTRTAGIIQTRQANVMPPSMKLDFSAPSSAGLTGGPHKSARRVHSDVQHIQRGHEARRSCSASNRRAEEYVREFPLDSSPAWVRLSNGTLNVQQERLRT